MSEFNIWPTDAEFTDSPDTGWPECTCSRCGNMIEEHEMPLRCFNELRNTEYRFCEACQSKHFGIDYSPRDDFDYSDWMEHPHPYVHEDTRPLLPSEPFGRTELPVIVIGDDSTGASVAAALAAANQSDVIIRVDNSPGGSFQESALMYEAMKNYQGNIIVKVDSPGTALNWGYMPRMLESPMLTPPALAPVSSKAGFRSKSGTNFTPKKKKRKKRTNGHKKRTKAS